MSDEGSARETEALRETLRRLRGDDGCPWDRERTLPEIVSHMIDEAYELLDAVHAGDALHMEEELGDVYMMLIFAHELMLERGGASLEKIVARVHEKIVSRHPHVFGDAEADDSAASNLHWERAKRAERSAPDGTSVMSGIPETLPPVRKADEIQKKAASTGFDWPDHEGVLGKLAEEVAELREAVDSGARAMVFEETGDILFTAVNLCRILGIDPEAALSHTNSKFIGRFISMERKIADSGKDLEDLSVEEMEKYWQASK